MPGAGAIPIRFTPPKSPLRRGPAGSPRLLARIPAHAARDPRHIRDDDIARLKARIEKPLNLEMAATREMVDIATRVRPHAACIVPERREERTTEGGLDAAGQHSTLAPLLP